MEVILKEDVAKLGARGEVVSVAEGYGRNYLLPKKLAVEATQANKSVIEQMKASAVRKLVKEKGDAELLGKQFEGVSLHFTRKAGEHDELEGRGFNVDRRKIELDQPLKSLGEFSVPIKLHKEVTVQIKVAVTKQDSEEQSA
jgi:large subunit ribosomal protein L9